MTYGSDPAVLRQAYRDGSNYLDRVALYAYQRPRIVFPDWVDSCEEFYASAVRVEWPVVLDRVRAVVADEIAERGTFEMETESGVFVCRTG